MRHETDAVVIGAGPVGLFAVFELGMARLKCHVVDALEAIGGQLIALYPEKPIYEIPGFPCILAAELAERLIEQAKPFQPHYHLQVTVESLLRLPDGRWEVALSDGRALIAPLVIIAAVAGAFGPNRPPLEGLTQFEGKSVFYLVQKREDLRDKRIVIAGGGDSAVDWAISLAEIAKRVMVVHRRAKFRAAPDFGSQAQALAEAGQIELVVPYQLHGLVGSGGQLQAVSVATVDGAVKTLEANVLLAFFGLASNLGPLPMGPGDYGPQIVADPATMATNLKGVFAIGDVAAYPGKMKLILQGFSEAAMAAQAGFGIARPGEALHFEHSTTTGLPVA